MQGALTSGHGFAASSRTRYALSLIFLRIVLDICYYQYVGPAFGDYYVRPLIVDFEIIRYFVSYLAMIPLFLLPYRKEQFESVFFLSGTIFIYIPMCVIWGMDKNAPSMAVVASILCLAVSYFVVFRTQKESTFRITNSGERVLLILSLAASAAFLVYSIVSGAASKASFNLADIYLLRDEQAEILDTGLVAYFNLWVQKIFNPLIIIIGIYRRNWILVGVGVAMQIYFFGVTQHRAHLVLPIILFLIAMLYRGRTSIAGLVTLVAASLAMVLVISLALNLEELPAITIRRAFFVPPSVMFDWVEYFSVEPYIFWSDKLLSWLIPSQYNGMETSWYIGKQITGYELAYNTGLVGAGFANAGLFGVAFYSALLGLVVRFVSILVRNGLPIYIPAALMFGPIRTAWADADLFAALLSHGIVIGILVLFVYGAGQPGPAARASSSRTWSERLFGTRAPVGGS